MRRETVGGSSELQDYLTVLKARKWTLALVFCVVVATIGIFSYRQTPIYSAQARVLVQPYPSADSAAPPPNLLTESQLVTSEPVAVRVLDELALEGTPRSIVSGLGVEAVTETEVLNISYSSPDAELAQDGANAFARSYIEFRREQALGDLESARGPIQRKLRAIEERLIDVQDKYQAAIQSGDNSLDARRLDAERSVLTTRLVVTQQRLDDVEPDSAVTEGGSQIIQAASRPTVPGSPGHRRDLTLGVALGLILGVGTVFLRERLDDRFRSRTDVAQVTGAPVLATVPRFKDAPGNGSRSAPVIAVQPSSVASETYRTLRTNTEFAMLQGGFNSMLITSPSAGEGKTVTTANLGVAAAQAGGRVLLASTDLRRPALEKHFGITNRTGVSSWLIGQSDDLWALIQPTPVPNLAVLPSGPVPPNPAGLLASPRLEKLVHELEQSWDLVLFDSPPVLPVADAMILASKVGSALLVVNASSTRRSAAAHAKERLNSVGAELIGSVLNEFDPSAPPYGYQYYYYYDSQPPGAPPTNGRAAFPPPPPPARADRPGRARN